MKRIVDYVNVFQGNSTVDLEKPSGVASTWYPIKGLSGNTHPGAQLPFGKISSCAYSGGYPTGYGNNRLNCGEPVEKLYDKKSVLGVSHIHHSGTGAVGFYYNYALTTPYNGSLTAPQLNTLTDEVATPGYYSARFFEKNIKFELTTDSHSVFHKYHFTEAVGNVSVDFSNDGLYSDPRLHSTAGESVVKIIDPNTVTASVTLQGLKLFFTVYCDSGIPCIWQGFVETDKQEFTTNGTNGRFGVCFKNTAKHTNVIVTVSLKSEELSLSYNVRSRLNSFDEVKAEASNVWESYLSRIQIETDDKNKEIFYSNLYHSLVKPSDWSGESIYYMEEDFTLDFTTLWDVYKTQLPLIFTVYPEISSKIINTYVNMGKSVGVMPNLFDLSSRFNGEAQQARFLAGYLFCDAYYRGLPADWNIVLDTLIDNLFSTEADFFEKGECSRTTHTLDMAEACANLTNVAVKLGRSDVIDKLSRHIGKWKNAFDETNGLLKENSEYYEGNLWNYSFRPMNDMAERIKLAGGSDAFTLLLDRFFGFTDPDDMTARFEGFNNETDMETPYAYNYVGRLDRLAEVVTSGTKYMFTTGEGGAPGNVDSGGLSACYLWNAIGIFPVSGQNLMLVGMPYFSRSSFRLSNGNIFTVVRNGNGSYVRKAELNGKDLSDFKFTVTEMMCGGTLNLYT